MDAKEQKKFENAINYLASRSKPAEMPAYLSEMLHAPAKNWAFTLNDKYSVVGNVSFEDPVDSTLFPGFHYDSSVFTIQDEDKRLRKANISIVYHSDFRKWDGRLNFLNDAGTGRERLVSIVSATRKKF